MPVSILIDTVRHRVEVTAGGILTGEEMLTAQREIAQSPGFEPGFDALFDLAAVSSVKTISAAEIRAVAHNTVFGPRVRRAFVTRNTTVYGMMRMLDAYLGDRGGEVGMFEDRATAERWLDRS